MVSVDLQKLLLELGDDLVFLTNGAGVANQAYQRALQSGESSEQKMMELSWCAVGFEELVKFARGFQGEIKDFLQEDGPVDTGISAPFPYFIL